MKNKILLTSVLTFFMLSCVYAQNLKLGVAGNIMTSNKYLDYQFGPSIMAEYMLNQVPVSIKGELRFTLADAGNFKPLSNDYILNKFSFGVSANYFPINWDIQPYVGLGIFYAANDLQSEGNSQPLEGRRYAYLESDKGNIESEIKVGARFSAKSRLNIFVEMTKTFAGKVHYRVYDSNPRVLIQQEDISINNSTTLRLGLIFSI
jgi:hypothetical protein